MASILAVKRKVTLCISYYSHLFLRVASILAAAWASLSSSSF